MITKSGKWLLHNVSDSACLWLTIFQQTLRHSLFFFRPQLYRQVQPNITKSDTWKAFAILPVQVLCPLLQIQIILKKPQQKSA